MKMKYIIDAGVENIHIIVFQQMPGPESSVLHDVTVQVNDHIRIVLKRSGLFREDNTGKLICNGDIYITGKLSEIVRSAFDRGVIILPAAGLWSCAKWLLNLPENKSTNSIGIADVSASGYMVIGIDNKGDLIEDSLTVNPRCGAGSGINLNRILEKLAIDRDFVDEIMSKYLGEEGREKREAVPVRSDRCGVFSSSATISDKNQGIPLDYALAITMKSEILKACRKMKKVSRIYLTGRLFSWQFIRDCACDYFNEIGVRDIVYDDKQMLLINGVKYLTTSLGNTNIRIPNKIKLHKPETLFEYPSFKELKERYESNGRFIRISDPIITSPGSGRLEDFPINIGLDVGSTMAKMVVSNYNNDELLFINSYNNHGDTIETIKLMFDDLRSRGAERLNIQNIGITGSGRYQVQKSLLAIYPGLSSRIITLVENYAHAYGSIKFAKAHMERLKNSGLVVNQDFCVLIDIGGEDTKISIITLQKNELFDNAMNIKCSAGTGSLMDTLKALFGIQDISEACKRAYEAPRAYGINATCAVFLMENARKMQASGYGTDEILASCNYAIVENMAQSLWTQIEFPQNAVVLLHGQTMLSDPLPLAVTHRVQEFAGSSYCIVPPFPGHRACIGLISSIDKSKPLNHEYYNLSDYISQSYERKIIECRGAACGDSDARCARTRLSSDNSGRKISLMLGGCTAVNEMQSGNIRSKADIAPDTYKDIWHYFADRLPRSEREDRLAIPRSFAVSDQAYFFARIFENLGIPVHCDDVKEQDIINAQPLFAIDTCAPSIGAAGQYIRLASEKHGYILAPQIDYLPTNGTSLGRTCTTNQGGVVIAMHFAGMKYPDARFLMFHISLKNTEPVNLANQLYNNFQPVFRYYNKFFSRSEFTEAVIQANTDNLQMHKEISDKTADYIEQAIEQNRNISIVCAREYVLNPGIYDSHIGKILRDKGVIALPSYSIDTVLDINYSYMYWKNPHDILTKIDAIARKQLHKIAIHPRMQDLFKKIEHGLTDTVMSVVQVSTFRCGPDSVAFPMCSEITKNMPSLYIQSDAVIKELAHLENRANTHINQLNKRIHKELSSVDDINFSVEMLSDFVLDGINSKTDVIYFPTLSDNRVLSSLFRAAGVTTIDNYDDDSFDLVSKVKAGRKYAGDAVCVPLSAVYADMLSAVQDFTERKKNNDPITLDKNRILVFMNGGDGPCRLGQYVDVFKLLLYRQFRDSNNTNKEILKNNEIKILVNLTSSISKDTSNVYIEDWLQYQGLQAVIMQAVLHSVYLKGAVLCRNNDEYKVFWNDFVKLKQKIYNILENRTRPSKITKSIVNLINRKFNRFGGIAKFFGYGFYNNNGLRKPLIRFSQKWIAQRSIENSNPVRIYVEGEVYVRVAQIEEIFKILIDEFGFGSFQIDYSPVWLFLEYILENRILVAKDEIRYKEETLHSIKDEKEAEESRSFIEKKYNFIQSTRSAVSNLRNIFARPLYKAAGIEMPYSIESILQEAEIILPTLKPHGELAPYVGEAIKKIRGGIDLFINAAPEGCMVSSMGEVLTPKILDTVKNANGRIQHLFTMDGGIDNELLLMALLKRLGPEDYYRA